MSEEFTFSQAFRKGGAIYRDPWSLIAPAAAMKSARHQLLTCAAGTLNEYGCVARTKRGDPPAKRTHGWCVANQLVAEVVPLIWLYSVAHIALAYSS